MVAIAFRDNVCVIARVTEAMHLYRLRPHDDAADISVHRKHIASIKNTNLQQRKIDKTSRLAINGNLSS